jgi:molybdopterin-guanine dinucleotide biosynthesis protein
MAGELKQISTWELFHRLWTKAVGQPDYKKPEWQELETRILRSCKYVKAECLKVGDKFKHVNREGKDIWVVSEVSANHVTFRAEQGHVLFSVTKDTVVECIE